MIIIIMIIIQN